MKKASQTRVNLVLLLSICVMSSIFFAPYALKAMTVKPVDPKDICFLSFSSKISDEVKSRLRSSLRDYLDGDCQLLSSTIEDPFSDTSKAVWPKVQGIGLWVGLSTSSSELTMRGFDLESGLEFGSTKNISARNLVSSLLKQHPMAGMIRPEGYILWKEIGAAPLQILERKQIRRHPFLPNLLEIEGVTKKIPVLKQREGNLASSSDFSLDTRASLWLKVVEAHE